MLLGVLQCGHLLASTSFREGGPLKREKKRESFSWNDKKLGTVVTHGLRKGEQLSLNLAQERP